MTNVITKGAGHSVSTNHVHSWALLFPETAEGNTCAYASLHVCTSQGDTKSSIQGQKPNIRDNILKTYRRQQKQVSVNI